MTLDRISSSSFAAFLLWCLWVSTGCAGSVAPAAEPAAPRIFPDYAGIVLPPNIAPLNFRIEEPGDRYRVELRSTRGAPLVIDSRTGTIQIPIKAWRGLLTANTAEPLYLEVSARNPVAGWTRFATVTNYIAKEPIDSFLAYRLLKPLYNSYTHLGIYQRDLESFEQRPILENSKFGGDCLNCHTFLSRNPNTFAFNIRNSSKQPPMMLIQSNKVTRIDKTMGYLAWHPSGRLLTFSVNKLSLFFHSSGETRDVFDARSDLGIYRVDSNSVVFPPSISLPDRNETWPTWSPDGRYLYYSSAPRMRLETFRRVRYDIVRVSYDLDRNAWGEPEQVVSAEESGLSACQPKISPDGRFLLFTMCAYGNFPIYQTNSDLYLMDLGTRKYRRLDINSDQADSWHSWSSNSRWVVFSSKRIDGLFARPHFSYVDDQGEFHKAFVLPQRDPAFYDSYLNTFNVPELIQGPVVVKESELARGILRPRNSLTPQPDPKHPAPFISPKATSAPEPDYRPTME